MFSSRATLLVSVPFNRRPICPLSLSIQPCTFSKKTGGCAFTWPDIKTKLWKKVSRTDNLLMKSWMPISGGISVCHHLLCAICHSFLASHASSVKSRHKQWMKDLKLLYLQTIFGHPQLNWVWTHTLLLKMVKHLAHMKYILSCILQRLCILVLFNDRES